MSTALGSIVVEVEAAISGGDPERRRHILRKMTDLFADEAARLREDHVAAFGAVFMHLAHGIETEARAELSRRLATFPNAPSAVLRDLASDASAEVAGPVLERWPLLTETELAHMAEWRGQGHLLALARRAALTPHVIDLLIKRGDQQVLRAVARNEGVRISERGYKTLMSRAVGDPDLVAALVKRDDVPPALRKRLNAVVEDQTQHVLNAAFGMNAQEAIIGERTH